jgi:hypothetical protein
MILVIFSLNLQFIDRFLTEAQISNFIKTHPMGAKPFCAKGQTYDKANIAFHNSANMPKNAGNLL